MSGETLVTFADPFGLCDRLDDPTCWHLTDVISAVLNSVQAKAAEFYAQGIPRVQVHFLPRALGLLSAVGGLGWLIYLYESLARRLESYIVGVGLIGAVVTVL